MPEEVSRDKRDIKIEMAETLLNEGLNSKENSTESELKDNDLCPNLSMKNRFIIFIILNIIGYCLQLGGITKIFDKFYNNEYKEFAILYTVGKSNKAILFVYQELQY